MKKLRLKNGKKYANFDEILLNSDRAKISKNEKVTFWKELKLCFFREKDEI